jgi:polysaccharide export outer membrane protein
LWVATRIVLGLWLGLAACGSGAVIQYDYAKEVDPRRTEFIIGIADQLAIRVWKNNELSTEAVVRPDGTITMPLVGDISADGKTPTQLRQEITKLLGNYVRDDAVVTVAVTAINSYSFTVSGNVEHPGIFHSTKYVTVFDAVQLAGGPNRFSSPRETKLYRRDRKGNMRIIPIDYNAVAEGKEPLANLALLAGDRIDVP